MKKDIIHYGLLVIMGILVGLILSTCNSNAQRIVKVLDGDTYVTSIGQHIRLANVDAPELSQKYGQQAKEFAETWLLNKEVRIETSTKDHYSRQVAEIWINGVNFSQLIVKNGYAWVYKNFDYNGIYPLMLEARKHKRGMWINKYNQPPFIYRKQNKLL